MKDKVFSMCALLFCFQFTASCNLPASEYCNIGRLYDVGGDMRQEKEVVPFSVTAFSNSFSEASAAVLLRAYLVEAPNSPDTTMITFLRNLNGSHSGSETELHFAVMPADTDAELTLFLGAGEMLSRGRETARLKPCKRPNAGGNSSCYNYNSTTGKGSVKLHHAERRSSSISLSVTTTSAERCVSLSLPAGGLVLLGSPTCVPDATLPSSVAEILANKTQELHVCSARCSANEVSGAQAGKVW
ncbi:hypothetical protein CYMTET_50967, partial [Cymbomonas tetramitiformis]